MEKHAAMKIKNYANLLKLNHLAATKKCICKCCLLTKSVNPDKTNNVDAHQFAPVKFASSLFATETFKMNWRSIQQTTFGHN